VSAHRCCHKLQCNNYYEFADGAEIVKLQDGACTNEQYAKRGWFCCRVHCRPGITKSHHTNCGNESY
jgi:hypothetical protein